MSTRRSNGEGSIYRKGDGWQVALRYTDPGTRKRRRATATAKTRREAVTKLDELRRLHSAQKPVIESKDTLEHAVETWLEVYAQGSQKPTTIRDNRYLVNRRIVPYIGHIRLDELDEVVVLEWQKRLLADGASPSYVQKARQVLGQVLDRAVEDGQIRRNAVRSIPGPRVEPKEAKWWTSEQVARLLQVAEGDRVAPLLRFLAYSGVREGEALALRWVDVDLESGRAQITGTLVRLNGKLVRQSPKTRASRNAIDLHPLAVEALLDARAQQDADAAASEWHSNREGYIFTTASGEPTDARNVLRSFSRIKKRAGITDGSIHTFRHSFAAQLVEAGTSIHAVSRHLRHARVSITQDVYGHLAETGIREQVFAGLDGYGTESKVRPLRAVSE